MESRRSENSWAGCWIAVYHLAGIPIAEAIDVDRPDDIETAEAFLRSASR